MPITPAELAAITAILEALNTHLNTIVAAREDVTALLRIVNEINNNTIEDAVLAQAKLRAKTAAQAIVTLLS